MATIDQLNSFHKFALQRLQSGTTEETIADLYNLWRLHNPIPADEDRRAIQDGLDDLKAGRTKPATEVLAELRARTSE